MAAFWADHDCIAQRVVHYLDVLHQVECEQQKVLREEVVRPRRSVLPPSPEQNTSYCSSGQRLVRNAMHQAPVGSILLDPCILLYRSLGYIE